MNCSIGMDMNISANAAGGLSLQDSVQRRSRALREVQTRLYASIIGHHNLQPVFMQHVYREAIEEIAVLLEYISLRAFPDNCRRWQDQHVLEFFHGNLKADSLARSKPPDNKCLIIFVVGSGLVRKWNEEVERSAGGIDGIGEMPDLQGLIKRWPVDLIVFSECTLNWPFVFSRLRQK